MTTQNKQPNTHDPRPESPESSSPPANPNTQLYGESGQKVQSSESSKNEPSEWTRAFRNTPWILWIIFFPFLVIGTLYFGVSSLFDGLIPKRWRASGFFGLVQITVGAILAALFINTFIFQSYQVVGDSMLPTLQDGDRLIINKLGSSWDSLLGNDHVPKRGDVIIFDDPNGSQRQLVKRVIGLPGDTVVIDGGQVTIFNDANPEGFNPDESYANSLTMDSNYSLRDEVEEGKLFVAGDNRIGGASFDSRNDLGQVPLDHVIGDLILRLLPLSESRFF